MTAFSLAYLSECFTYCEITGKLYWKVRPRHHFKSDQVWLSNNTKYAHKLAGNVKRNKKSTYIKIKLDQKNILAHRIVWTLNKLELWPEMIDHIDGDGTNNRIENLRKSSPMHNSKNQRLNSNNTAGLCGVSFCSRGQIRAHIKSEGVPYYKYFKDFFEACCWRKSRELQFDFSEGHGKR